MTNVIFFAWSRSLPGREPISSAHFNDFVQYVTGLQKTGTITSFEVVFLNPPGVGCGGFFLLRGDGAKLAQLMLDKDWITHMTRAQFHLENSGAVLGATGDAVMERFALWNSTQPS